MSHSLKEKLRLHSNMIVASHQIQGIIPSPKSQPFSLSQTSAIHSRHIPFFSFTTSTPLFLKQLFTKSDHLFGVEPLDDFLFFPTRILILQSYYSPFFQFDLNHRRALSSILSSTLFFKTYNSLTSAFGTLSFLHLLNNFLRLSTVQL